MSRSKEMKEKFDKIRELQEQRDRHERDAQSQADDLDAILEASRRAHGEEQPLVSSSRLSGPGFGETRRVRSTDPESAYDVSFSAARFASPNAFSRNRSTPTTIPDGSTQALAQRTTNSAAAATNPPAAAPATREPAAKAQPPSTTKRTEHTVTMTVKAFAPMRNEVTEVVRKRKTPDVKAPRREPPAVSGPLSQASAKTDASRFTSEDTPIAGMAAEGTATVPGSRTVTEPNVSLASDTVTERVVFRPQAASSRKVTSPAYGFTHTVAHDALHGDTVPTAAARGKGTYDDTAPGGSMSAEDTREVTTPGGFGAEAHEPTSPGISDKHREITAPGAWQGVARHTGDTDPGRAIVLPAAPVEVTVTVKDAPRPAAPAMTPPPMTPSMTAMPPAAPVEARVVVPTIELPPPPPETDTSPGPASVAPNEPTAIVEESVVDDAQYKRVREMDALIARFASDVEVKTGRGRENTFLRKRSEIQGAPKEEPDEHTQPRHRAVEVRRENTEIIQRPLPPRKRR
jgi:hypothetical protein